MYYMQKKGCLHNDQGMIRKNSYLIKSNKLKYSHEILKTLSFYSEIKEKNLNKVVTTGRMMVAY